MTSISRLKCYCFCMLFFAIFLIVSANSGGSFGGTPPASECPPGDVCWVMQTKSKMKVGDKCTIIRILSQVGNDTQNSTSNSGPGDNSTENSNTTAVEKPEEMVIDECKDEENRSFMECVLNYNPTIKEGDPGYNEGVCMCYRDWSVNSDRMGGAYTHVLNYTLESHEWFFFSQKYDECIVRLWKRCAPAGTQNVPYRCEEPIDPETGKIGEARCSDSDDDPYYMVCGGRRSKIFMTPLAVVATISFNLIRLFSKL